MLKCACKEEGLLLQTFIDFPKVHQACQKLNTLRSNYEQVRRGVNLPFDQNRLIGYVQLGPQEKHPTGGEERCDG